VRLACRRSPAISGWPSRGQPELHQIGPAQVTTGLPSRIHAYDFAIGRTELVPGIERSDTAVFVRFNGMFVSGDGASYACSYHLVLSDLYIADAPR
jgi:hypothetical protein